MADKTRDFATPVATPPDSTDELPMFLVRKGNTYYFRRKVPSHLRTSLEKREFIKSLKTSNITVAMMRAGEYMREIAHHFEKTVSEEVSWLSDDEIKRFCQGYIFRRIEEHKEFTRTLLSEHRLNAHEHLCKEIESYGQDAATASAIGAIETYDASLPVFLKEQGILLAKNFSRESLDRLRQSFVDANATLFEYKRALRDGRPAEILKPKSVPKSFTILKALKEWEDLGNRNAKTTHEMDRLANEFSSHYPGDLRYIERSSVVAFFTAKKTLRRETLVKQKGLLRALCAVGVENEMLSNNPFADIRIQVGRDSMVKEGFTASELEELFASSLISEDAQMEFLCTLALVTGARIEELCQLEKRDFIRDGSVLFISINRESDKQTKNLNSIRSIPIHPAFLEFVEQYLNNRDQPFELQADKFGRKSSAISKRFNRFIRNTQKLPPSKSFHSFRHSFKTACRDAGIPEEIHDALTGHSGGKVSRRYGAFSISTLFDAVSKLKFPVKK